MMHRYIITFSFMCCLWFGSRSQALKNAEFTDLTPVENGKSVEGFPLNYYSVEGEVVRPMAGKEFPYYKAVNEGIVNGVNAGWINSPAWKRKFEWSYGESYPNGMCRKKSEDEKNYPNRFVLNNIFQPAKGHPLYQYFLNKNDSLYQPAGNVANSREYITKVQNYENNSPRLSVNIHINNLYKTTSISAFSELNWPIKLKTPYKVYQRNDSIWFKSHDVTDQDATDMRFQKNTIYVIIGAVKDVDFTKGMTDGVDEYRMTTYPNKENTSWSRLDHVIIELTGHPESIKLFFDKIDWKLMEKAFKTKVK